MRVVLSALAALVAIGLPLLSYEEGPQPTKPPVNEKRLSPKKHFPHLPENKKYPRLHAAIHELKKAIEELDEAPWIFGGHKAAAIELAENAVSELYAALRYRDEQDEAKKGGEKPHSTPPPAKDKAKPPAKEKPQPKDK